MKAVSTLLILSATVFTVPAFAAPTPAADKCFYFAGSDESDPVHRVSLRGDLLTVKLMGPNLSEIRGLGCAYRVKDASDRSSIILENERKLSGPCAGNLPINDNSYVIIEKAPDRMATAINGLSTYHAQVSDEGSTPYWAHPCSEVDAR